MMHKIAYKRKTKSEKNNHPSHIEKKTKQKKKQKQKQTNKQKQTTKNK